MVIDDRRDAIAPRRRRFEPAEAGSRAGISAIAAVDRSARASGVRLSIVAGGGSVAIRLRRAGLLDRLQLEGVAEVFMDWSR